MRREDEVRRAASGRDDPTTARKFGIADVEREKIGSTNTWDWTYPYYHCAQCREDGWPR